MKKKYSCPGCGKNTILSSENPWRPFCSERCKLIDLGDWIEEKNKIASEPADFVDLESDKDNFQH
jgi:endogenous inhibitor of DNA gyrase (YacG/DUF329 family)